MNTEADRSPDEAAGARAAPSMRQRLSAMLERGVDAFGGWNAGRFLRELQQVLDPAVSEVEGGRRAAAVADEYARATPEQRRACWLLMSAHFRPDVSAIQAAHAAYETARGTEDESRAEVRLRRAFTAPRTRLLQRFSAYPGGVRFLVELRAELLPHLKKDKRLIALDDELQELFSTWFDVGFLELRRISWESPAALLEKVIAYEAVHPIKSWDDLKNRLSTDRRCFAFFHPRMPNEPLIIVQVALVHGIADNVQTLLDESAPVLDPTEADTAIFYSISNAHEGLSGISFGNFLIKRVVDELTHEFKNLKTFATLSPIPGFRGWLDAKLNEPGKDIEAELLTPTDRKALAVAANTGTEPVSLKTLLQTPDWSEQSDLAKALKHPLQRLCARYLAKEKREGGTARDRVAHFHLSNGSRIERLNWLADTSPKGLSQSAGMMVNYLYKLDDIEANHEAYRGEGKVMTSSSIRSLLKA